MLQRANGWVEAAMGASSCVAATSAIAFVMSETERIAADRAHV